MDPPVPSISESEWKIMKLLWAKSPQPAYDLIAVLAKTEDWHPNTIKTLLSRLHKKRALGIKKCKNLYRYSPLVFEEACVHAESESFLHLMLVSALAAATTLPSGEAASASTRPVKPPFIHTMSGWSWAAAGKLSKPTNRKVSDGRRQPGERRRSEDVGRIGSRPVGPVFRGLGREQTKPSFMVPMRALLRPNATILRRPLGSPVSPRDHRSGRREPSTRGHRLECHSRVAWRP